MDVALGIICLVAIGFSTAGGLIVWHRAQNKIRHGTVQNAKRVDLRRQGYSPRKMVEPLKVRAGR